MTSCIDTKRDVSISVVIDNSVPEKSPMSAITDNSAPDKSDIVDSAHNSSLDTNLCNSTRQTSLVISMRVLSNRSWSTTTIKNLAVNHFLEISTQPGTNDIHG